MRRATTLFLLCLIAITYSLASGAATSNEVVGLLKNPSSPHSSSEGLRDTVAQAFAQDASPQDSRWLSQPSRWRWTMLPTKLHLPNIGADRMRSGCGSVLHSLKHPDFVKAHAGKIFSFQGPSTLLTKGKAAVSHQHLPKAPKVIVRPVKAATGLLGSLGHFFATQWKEADGPKQTFMAVIAILQIVWLACTVKGWLDRLFGRGSHYRNKRTKSFARRAAVAAAGGLSGKPRLPPRPSAGHPLSSPMSEKRGMQLSTAPNGLVTTSTGEIVLPSWTETGPTSLMVIVEEPELEKVEEEELRRLSAHEKKRSDWDRMAGEWDDGFDSDAEKSSNEQGWSSSNTGRSEKWMSRLSCQSDGGSLRYRERREGASLPSFRDDRPSLPSTPQMESLASNRSSMEGRYDPESYWQRSDALDMERNWRDSCLEEGFMQQQP